MAQIYRKSALEKLSSPEQLDVPLKISSPVPWVAAIGAAALLIITLVWSLCVKMPKSVTANGMIVSSQIRTSTIYSDYQGTVSKVYYTIGDKIYKDDFVMEILTDYGESINIRSGQVGYVSEVVHIVGDKVKVDDDLIRLSPEVNGSDRVVVAYIPKKDADSIKQMLEKNSALNNVDVVVSGMDSQKYGHMIGRIVNMDRTKVSDESASYVLGLDNNMRGSFPAGDVIAATIELHPDPETVSGYSWSNEKGRTVAVESGTMCQVRVITEQITPMEKLIDKILEIWNPNRV